MQQTTKNYAPPPRLSELGLDLLQITSWQRTTTIVLPFFLTAIYFVSATMNHWVPAVGALVYLSFITYGSTSHDLVHRNLGLSIRTNEIFLTLIELVALRSGHAYRMAHLHHHARFPEEDDIEASAARKSFIGALLEGVIYHPRLWVWALKRAHGRERKVILLEGLAASLLIFISILTCRTTLVPLIYVLLMVTGAWITPLVTSYIPHNPSGKNDLEQTRVFRGTLISIIAMEHLYHLEHHLYPSVPHHNWPRLARRLDPFLKKQGIVPIKLWF
jgi:beta-carotene hydroxylase